MKQRQRGWPTLSLEAINKTNMQVTSSSATYGEKTEGRREKREINTTFAVHFINGHHALGSEGVTDVELNDNLFFLSSFHSSLIKTCQRKVI